MTVGELIKRLEAFPSDLIVCTGGFGPMFEIKYVTDTHAVEVRECLYQVGETGEQIIAIDYFSGCDPAPQ